MVRIELAQPKDHWPTIIELMQANWYETGFEFDFNPSQEMYQKAVDAGVMFSLAAFDGDTIVGYCTMLVTPHMHNPGVVFAANDALFVSKEYRGITGARLIKAAEDEAKRRGARYVSWHTRAGTQLAAVLERRGYIPADVVVMREL